MKQPHEHGYSIIWHAVLPWYVHATGANPAAARGLMGKLAKEHGRKAIILAFDAMLELKERPADPGPYFIKLVQEQKNNGKPAERKPSHVEQSHAAIKQRRRLS